MSGDGTGFPPVVYVPCERPPVPDGDLEVDLRRTRDGRVALLVYSALDRLVRCCGGHQPWVVMPTANLDRVEHAPFDLILLDLEIPAAFREGVRDGIEEGIAAVGDGIGDTWNKIF